MANRPLKKLGDIGLGVGKLGIQLGVSGAIIGAGVQRAPQIAPIGAGLSTAAGFVAIGVTVMAGKTVLDSVKKLKKY